MAMFKKAVNQNPPKCDCGYWKLIYYKRDDVALYKVRAECSECNFLLKGLIKEDDIEKAKAQESTSNLADILRKHYLYKQCPQCGIVMNEKVIF